MLSLTPRTKVASGPSAGAEMMTFFTGAAKVFPGVGAIGEEAGGFDDDVGAHGGPVDFGGILDLENLEALAVDGDGIVSMRHFVGQIAENGIVFEQMSERFRIGDVVDGDKLDVLVVQARCAQCCGRCGRSH